MNVRSMFLVALFMSSCIFTLPKHPHYHYHPYDNLTTAQLVDLIEEKEDRIFWTKLEYGLAGAAVGFIVCWTINKLKGSH